MMAPVKSRARSAPFGSVLLGTEDQTPRRLRIRLQLLLTVMLVGTHVIGAVVVVVLSLFVLPTQALNTPSLVSIAVTVPVYVVAATLIGGVWATVSGLRATSWSREEREPTDAERRRVLWMPLWLTVIQGVLWAGGFVLFTTEALLLQPDRAMAIGFAIAISGVVVCGVAYLLSEFALRPIAAQALAGGPVDRRGVLGVAGRMMLFWGIGTAAPVVGLGIAATVAITSHDMSRTRLAIIALALCVVVLVFGALVTLLNARAVVAPISSVRRALEQVGTGNLDAAVTVYDGTELGRLQAGFNDMARGLREREALRDLFGRHVGREVASAAATGDVALGGGTRIASVLFIDLIGSTSYATTRDPQDVVRTLNAFFGVVVEEVDRHHGLVNKFMGDAALAVFGAPVDLPGHAGEALAAARAIATRLAVEVPQISAGIGVATGEVVAGNIGDESRFEYTVIGDSVNSAARLCDLAKGEESRLLVGATSVAAAPEAEQAFWRPSTPRVLRGRGEETATATLA
jgi:adenylate cyclase